MHSGPTARAVPSDLLSVILNYLQPRYQVETNTNVGRIKSVLIISQGDWSVTIVACFIFDVSGIQNQCPLRQFLEQVHAKVETEIACPLHFDRNDALVELYWEKGIINTEETTFQGKMAERIVDWLKELDQMRPSAEHAFTVL